MLRSKPRRTTGVEARTRIRLPETRPIQMTTSFGSAVTTRRHFVSLLAGGAALAACGGSSAAPTVQGGGNARLLSRPGTAAQPLPAGTHLLTPSNEADGVLIIPEGLPAGPAPLVIILHGAGQGSLWTRNNFASIAQSRRFVLLAPGARGLTWDAMTSKYSYDVTFIDSALAWSFARVAIDPSRILLMGFSDGASYTLGLGAANGDWIPRVAACSPGFIVPSDSPRAGSSQYFVSHGRQDDVLPIDGASRKIVPALRSAGYTVRYEEFDGGHAIPPAILDGLFGWAGL